MSPVEELSNDGFWLKPIISKYMYISIYKKKKWNYESDLSCSSPPPSRKIWAPTYTATGEKNV